MKLCLLGATGQTGTYLLNKALAKHHNVTVYVRHPEKIKLVHENLNIIKGDVLSVDDLSAAFKGHDAVISCLGGDDNNHSDILTRMAKNIVTAMKNNNMKRFVGIGTAGVHNEFSFVTNLIVKLFYKHAIEDHRGAVNHIMSSGLTYTIARPLSLTEGDCLNTFRKTPTGVPKGGKNISRCDLATFLLTSVEKDEHINETVGLAY